jgi:microcystin-dependent protein
MQQTYHEQFGALAALLGDKVIVSGVEVSGGNVSAGWITFGGRLIPFAAGLAQDRVVITTTTTGLLYQDGQTKQVYTTRVAQCVLVGGFLFSELKRLTAYKTLMDMVVPVGMISMWSGTVPPAGWALCDGGGSPARPDLRGRFIVGYDPGDSDYNAIGNAAGDKVRQIQALNLPEHHHKIMGGGGTDHAGSPGTNDILASSVGFGNNNSYIIKRATDQTGQPTIGRTGNTGGNQPIDIRPPYYTLAYIIKL